MFVTDAARGLGVGRALLVAAEERARELGATTMRSRTGCRRPRRSPCTSAAATVTCRGSGRTRRIRRASAWSATCGRRPGRSPGGSSAPPSRTTPPGWPSCAPSSCAPTSSGSAGGTRCGSAAASSTAGQRSAPPSSASTAATPASSPAATSPTPAGIEHFYLDPAAQGRGIGGEVLGEVMARHDDGRPFRLDVLQGSAARRLYERAGFRIEREDAVDAWLVALPTPRAEDPVRRAVGREH
ncbi:GNAT family N-acetyltransferase [Clavibacter zhangzhiyongii]|uniref:GNAT family N-acetyltransferase n=1 Tax=Clavibacter zhangzhiyongii TaxID=2768071 RepID=UPI0031451705